MLEHLRRGAAVAIANYHRNAEGHLEYVDNISAGQTVLDAIKATQELGISPEAPADIYGYPKGGGAAAAAAERARLYAHELKIAAVAAGGIPSRLTDVLEAVDRSSLTAVLTLAAATVLDKDPALRDYLYSVELSESTAEVFNTTQNLCTGDLILNYAFTETRDWSKDDSSLIDLINRCPAFIRELERQKIGRFTTEMPVFLYNVTNDDVIPVDDDVIPVEQAREVGDA